MCNEATDKSYITIAVNGKEERMEAGTRVEQLLEAKGMKSRSAVWINGTQLLLAEYPTHVLQEGDQIKLLRVVAGG